MDADEVARLRSSLEGYPELVQEEVDGLTWEQMCYAAREPAWARWCIDLQIRHIALVTPVWLSLRAEEMLRREGYQFPETAEIIRELIASGVRHVPPEVAPTRAGVIAFMRPWADICREIIDREGHEGLEKRTFTFYTDPEWVRPGDPKRPVEYHRIAAKLHPDGFREDEEERGLFHFHIGAVLRHIWWNVLAHLRTVQRLKMLEGLPVVCTLPREGYLTLSDFYD